MKIFDRMRQNCDILSVSFWNIYQNRRNTNASKILRKYSAYCRSNRIGKISGSVTALQKRFLSGNRSRADREKCLQLFGHSKNGSYLVIDPEGILEGQTSEKLKQEGYHVYICNVDDTKGFFYDYFRYYYYNIFHDEKTVLYLTGSDKIRNEKLIAEITLILDDILNGKMDLSQHLTLMVNDFGHLAGGINFPHKLSRIKGTQVSAILCTESLLPLQTEHYNPMLTDEILDSCNVITEK